MVLIVGGNSWHSNKAKHNHSTSQHFMYGFDYQYSMYQVSETLCSYNLHCVYQILERMNNQFVLNYSQKLCYY